MKHIILLDMRQMKDKAAAHRYLAKKLKAPEWYGNNLDALHDILTDLSATVILRYSANRPADSYAAKVMGVFQNSAAENPKLELEYR